MFDPILLTVLSIFALLAAWELLRPGRKLPDVRAWHLKGVAFFALSLSIAFTVPVLWDGWFAQYSLFDVTGLGHLAGGVVAFLVLELGIYLWHRALHASDFLWRWFHQLHHSAERVDIFGAYYFHPLDSVGFAFVSSLALVFVLGPTAPAAIAASLGATFFGLFQHSNLKTPRWLGYVIHRPESHALHHQRDVHAFNYGDIPLWDMVFGTFRNPVDAAAEHGFYPGASNRVVEMLLGRDISTPPAVEGNRKDTERKAA